MTLMYKQQTLIASLNFTKIINLFLQFDCLITMLFQGLEGKLEFTYNTFWFCILIEHPNGGVQISQFLPNKFPLNFSDPIIHTAKAKKATEKNPINYIHNLQL